MAAAGPEGGGGSSRRLCEPIRGRVDEVEYRKRRNPFEIEILSYSELDYFAAHDHDGLILILDPERWPAHVPSSFERRLRIRIPLSDVLSKSLDSHEYLLRQSSFALNFARLHGEACGRIAICSPDGEVRGPGIAAGLLSALDFTTSTLWEFQRYYRKGSVTLRDCVLEAAGKLPPTSLEKAAASPLTKAALLVLAKMSLGRFHP